jgi:ribonuclease Z
MQVNGFRIEGISISGRATNIRLPGWDLMFDIGRCCSDTVRLSRLFLSHGHPDHVGSLAHYLFRRKLLRLPPPEIYGAPGLLRSLKRIARAFARLHGSRYPARFIALSPGERISLSPNRYVEAFESVHSIPCQGYSLFASSRARTALLSYTGDTSIEVLDQNPSLYRSRVLLIEASLPETDVAPHYFDGNSHVCWEDLFERAKRFRNERIVLVHHPEGRCRRRLQNALLEKAPHRLSERIAFL